MPILVVLTAAADAVHADWPEGLGRGPADVGLLGQRRTGTGSSREHDRNHRLRARSRARTVGVRVVVQRLDGATVAHRIWRRQAFARGERRQYRWTWAIPAARQVGRYTVKIGVFTSGVLRHWNNQAA